MRIAFYAPLKAPDHPKPSGDRRMARLIMDALQLAGHEAYLASGLRSYDSVGDTVFQQEVRDAAEDEVRQILAGAEGRPDPKTIEAWFTYHVYYKAPDWIGPAVADALSVPYYTAELSYALKRAEGPWALNHESVARSLQAGQRHFCFTATDREALESFLKDGSRVIDLPPFIEAVPELDDMTHSRYRHALRQATGFSPDVPIVLSVAMMRAGDKAASYRMLAETMSSLTDLPWGLVLVGDGAARPEIERAFSGIDGDRLHWAGEVPADELERYYAGSDFYVWPAHNEAYGMAFLEAQSYGLPVVAQRTRGVPDVVASGRTGLLTQEGSIPALTDAVRRLISDAHLRDQMGQAAREFVASARTIAPASAILDKSIMKVGQLR